MEKKLIDIEQVKKVAKLTGLDISGQEERFVELFNETLNYVEILGELNTEEVGATYHVTGLNNVFQKKEDPANTLSAEETLKNAKDSINNLFITKAVFER
ncbi:Asp-tRNA(Asn)/Glu-tRNA(Gln) amidotransferase GatCAB subunit C [candidate division WWE3 bacterium]|jgi:aspartyl/glutamyl-tRNA(Asn/Gln) amidotransferase C subunit|uniref:Asp-tRNA(Asn)/Glu-tRNA(Gln) amidotransferase GatCAB subunit C n=1 Tax=candidate division WWE3 bacterium TaxID=2053526 RepID=A0A3A4ZIP0_UNCKA|nr:MAG: Asp-tRNA(Asn)/Glu-tRNA(Gln) amidotransferase GatCAB subunit C [candidate division WWE3 bacterium]